MGSSADKFKPPPRFGNYDVREALGEGGMATVFRAEHVLLQRAAAIKFLHADLGLSDAARARFLREARVVAKLTHPNVVSIFDFGVTEDGTYYLASELVDGPTLREFVRGRRLEAWRALRFARQIAAGLGSAHEAGVIHRDLKPSNVMVVSDKAAAEGYRLKVLDFGIAKSVNAPPASDVEVTEIGIVVGTPGYMSPEQCRAETDIGPATDIYSLGVVLYVMLCGQPPFIAADAFQLADMHVSVPAPVPSVTCGCTAQVDDLVLRMLAKSPLDRPTSMDEVIALIDAALADAPTAVGNGDIEPQRATEELERGALAFGTAPTDSSRMVTAPVPPRPRRPNRAWIALVVCCVIGAGVLAALVWPSQSSPELDVAEPSMPIRSEAPATTLTPPTIATPAPVPPTPEPAAVAAEVAVDAGVIPDAATVTETHLPPPPVSRPPTKTASPPATIVRHPIRKTPRPKRKPPAAGSGSAQEAPDYSFEKPID